MLEEIWKDIPGYESKYQVSNQGRVKRLSQYRLIHNQYGECVSLLPEKLLRIADGPTPSVVLDSKQHYVDRLVFSAFNDVAYADIVKIIHNDGDKHNSNLTNLMPVLNTDFADDIWKVCPYYADYEVSYQGHVRVKEHDSYYSHMGRDIRKHHYNARILTVTKTDDGYLYVTVRDGLNSDRFLSVHRLVAMTWLDDWDESLTVNHKDGNKENNCASNLEMMTQAENSYHYTTADCFIESRSQRSAKLSAKLKGRQFTDEQRAHMSASRKGRPSWLSDPDRLTPEVHAMLKKNAESAPGFLKRQPCRCIETGQKFESLHAAAAYFNVDDTTMKDWIVNGHDTTSKKGKCIGLHFEYIHPSK